VFLGVDAAGGIAQDGHSAHGQGLSAASRAARMARDTRDGMWLQQGDSSTARRGQQRGRSACTRARSRARMHTHTHAHICMHAHQHTPLQTHGRHQGTGKRSRADRKE